MANVLDYIKWRGDVSFSESPLNEIDALIFSELLYASFDDFVSPSLKARGVPLSAVGEKYFTLHYDRNKIGAIIPTDDIIKLLKIASESRRFGNVVLKGFVNEVDIKTQKQFCAVCYEIGKNTKVVAFRGTDDTIIGWKEDLNMAFFTPIPSQKHAFEYLENVIDVCEKEHIYVCGHSKGGNLAAYSALMQSAEKQKVIEAVYNFDGPGFVKDFVKKQQDNPIIPKLHKFVPQGTIIGAIFDTVENCTYIKSVAKGLYQHDSFSWQLLGRNFEYVEKPSKASVNFHNTLNAWVENMTEKEKSEFVDALYTLLTANDSTTLTDIVSDKFKFIIAILKSDEKTKKTFVSSLNRLIKEKYFKKDNKPNKK